MHGVDAAVGICSGEREGVVLNAVAVLDQVNVDVINIFCIIGVVNDGVVVELLNGLCLGLVGECLE